MLSNKQYVCSMHFIQTERHFEFHEGISWWKVTAEFRLQTWISSWRDKWNTVETLMKVWWDVTKMLMKCCRDFNETKTELLQVSVFSSSNYWHEKCHGHLGSRLANDGAKSLFFELETSNFGSSFVFSRRLNLRGQILLYCTDGTQKWHISGKMQVPLCQKPCFLS